MEATPIHLFTIEDALDRVDSGPGGLTSVEAAARLMRAKQRPASSSDGVLRLMLNQVRSPLVILLLAAMALSFALGDRTDAFIVLAVVLMSTLLGFWQE